MPDKTTSTTYTSPDSGEQRLVDRQRRRPQHDAHARSTSAAAKVTRHGERLVRHRGRATTTCTPSTRPTAARTGSAPAAADQRLVERQVDDAAATRYPAGGKAVAVPVPLPDRRRRAPRRRVPRRHRREVGRHDVSPTTSRAATNGWTASGRLSRSAPAPSHEVDPRVLPGREPAVRRLRRHAAHRPVPVQRRPHRARLGGALPVPGRHARVGGRRDATATTTPSSTRATAWRCRSTPGRRRSPTPTAPKPSNRRQPFDATFGLQATDAVVPAQAGAGRDQAEPDRQHGLGLRAEQPAASRRSTTPTRTRTTATGTR